MGNCMRCESSAVHWADDEEDWVREDGSACQRQRQRAPPGKEETELLRRDAETAQAATDQVRIKIIKKRLEELLRYADAQGLPLNQLLAHLVSAADDYASLGRGRHWRPSLDGIPEVAE